MQITKIVLKGFKQFESFNLSCRERNVLVGPNNAGKSTSLDALRIVADVIRFSKRNKPQRVSHPDDGVCATFKIPDAFFSIPVESANRNYSQDPAKVEVKIENGSVLKISLDSVDGCVAHLVADGRIPETSTAFRKEFPIDLIIAPTLGPFEREERYLTDETVRSSENTRLAHRHFRNILFRKDDVEFSKFASLVAETWPGVTVEKPKSYGLPAHLSMLYEERRVPKEVHLAGFGFQVWLQMLLQVCRGTNNSILVLDEPDIYLHPDLQRRLVELISGRFTQFFIATHSTEIINEASSGDIVSINSSYKNGRRIGSDDDYRDLFKYIGSSENAQFSRVARAKRIVFFEGDDARLLRRLSDKVTSSRLLSDPDTLILKAGGFGQWQRVITTGWTLNSLFGMEARIVALFDRDYRCKEEVSDFVSKVSGNGVLCRVLERKEIENYCLEEAALVRTLVKRVGDRGKRISEPEALELIDECLEGLRVDASSQLMAGRVAYSSKRGAGVDPATVMKEAMGDFERIWRSRKDRLAIVSGKEFASALSGKVQSKFGCGITLVQLISEMSRQELSDELLDILSAFETHLAS